MGEKRSRVLDEKDKQNIAQWKSEQSHLNAIGQERAEKAIQHLPEQERDAARQDVSNILNGRQDGFLTASDGRQTLKEKLVDAPLGKELAVEAATRAKAQADAIRDDEGRDTAGAPEHGAKEPPRESMFAGKLQSRAEKETSPEHPGQGSSDRERAAADAARSIYLRGFEGKDHGAPKAVPTKDAFNRTSVDPTRQSDVLKGFEGRAEAAQPGQGPNQTEKATAFDSKFLGFGSRDADQAKDGLHPKEQDAENGGNRTGRDRADARDRRNKDQSTRKDKDKGKDRDD